jgi:hypothetical protein
MPDAKPAPVKPVDNKPAPDKPAEAKSASFWDELNTTYKSPGPARENFIFNKIKSLYNKDSIEKLMVPLDVEVGPNKKLRFKVMPNYLSIEGRPIPLQYATSRRVAQEFGVELPSGDMVRLIHQKATNKIPAKPLSGTGVTVDGKKYTGKQVVEKGVDYDPFVDEYAKRYNKELANRNVKETDITSGYYKEYTKPTKGNEGKTHFVGMFTEDGIPIQGGATGQGSSMHPEEHKEYATAFRPVSGTATLIVDGKPVEQLTADKALELYKETPQAAANPIGAKGPIPTSEIANKPVATSKKPEAAKPTTPSKPPTDKPELSEKDKEYIKKVDQLLESLSSDNQLRSTLSKFSSQVEERRRKIIDRAIRLGTINRFLNDM